MSEQKVPCRPCPGYRARPHRHARAARSKRGLTGTRATKNLARARAQTPAGAQNVRLLSMTPTLRAPASRPLRARAVTRAVRPTLRMSVTCGHCMGRHARVGARFRAIVARSLSSRPHGAAAGSTHPAAATRPRARHFDPMHEPGAPLAHGRGAVQVAQAIVGKAMFGVDANPMLRHGPGLT